jgi:hypothetical protein
LIPKLREIENGMGLMGHNVSGQNAVSFWPLAKSCVGKHLRQKKGERPISPGYWPLALDTISSHASEGWLVRVQ